MFSFVPQVLQPFSHRPWPLLLRLFWNIVKTIVDVISIMINFCHYIFSCLLSLQVNCKKLNSAKGERNPEISDSLFLPLRKNRNHNIPYSSILKSCLLKRMWLNSKYRGNVFMSLINSMLNSIKEIPSLTWSTEQISGKFSHLNLVHINIISLIYLSNLVKSHIVILTP